MRVSAKVQAQTRQAILDKAHRLFCLVGFETATMRDIAKAVGVAPGTLFNYFSGKEAIAASLVLSRPRAQVSAHRHQLFEESVFSHAATTIRNWKPCRNYLLPILQSSLMGQAGAAWEIEERSLEELQVVSQSTLRRKLTDLEWQLYWSLFLGTVAHWVRDRSRKQEATLALLDESVRMFARWVEGESSWPSSVARLPEGPHSA